MNEEIFPIRFRCSYTNVKNIEKYNDIGDGISIEGAGKFLSKYYIFMLLHRLYNTYYVHFLWSVFSYLICLLLNINLEYCV